MTARDGAALLRPDEPIEFLLEIESDASREVRSLAAVHLTPGVRRVGLRLADPVQAQPGAGAYDLVESALDFEIPAPESTFPAGTGGLVTCRFDAEPLH